MRANLILCLLLLTAWCCNAQQKDYPIRPVSFTQVKLQDSFWLPRMETNRTVTIPASFARCQQTGRIKNFEMAAARSGRFCTKFPFDDTDIYKTIEGASFSLAQHPDKQLDAYLDSLISKIRLAQEPDGYLYTARTIDPLHPHEWSGKARWVNENNMSHELYNSGHLFEAAAAHYQATGKRGLLDIALKNADLLTATFGPSKRQVAPGHEIVEMGLVRLYRITGKQEYLDLAKFFIDERGKRKYDASSADVWKNGSYFQDDKLVTDQDQAEGHAVRAMYLYSGMADVAALTGDQDYIRSIDRIWENMVGKKIYVQGGIGAVPNGERFGEDYELPNATAYNETCAAIGNVFWNQRMFLLHGESRYIDLLEKVLYNGLISGVGLDGKSFFYTNAMQVSGHFTHPALEAERSGWFECSCCPTNIARFLPSLPGYLYAQRGKDIYVNLYVSSSAVLNLGGKPVTIIQQNNYPWNGKLGFKVLPEAASQFTLRFRLPGWSVDQAIPSALYSFTQQDSSASVLRINGKITPYHVERGYAVVSRTWNPKDQVELDIPMPVRKVLADARLTDDNGRFALQQGPLIYCAEGKDNPPGLSTLVFPAGADFHTHYRKDLLEGVNTLQYNSFFAIPYYAWANRGKDEMQVWFPYQLNEAL